MDLPSNAPQMFQLPAPAQINQQPGLFQGVASGLNQGAGLAIQSRAVAAQQQAVQQQALKQKMEMVDSLIKNGLEYPDALLPMFWPTIAKTMNEINPAYQMDPSKPPENLQTWGKAISQTLDATNAGVVSLPQADQAVHQINNQHLTQPVAPNVGMDNQPPVSGEDAYSAAYQRALSLPPHQIQPALEALQKSPQALEMNSAFEQRKALELQQNTIQQANQAAATSNFTELTKDHQEVLPNGANALNMIAQPVPANATEAQKAEFALHDKQAMIKYAQMLIPSSKRPPNMTMEDMIKSGLAGEQVKTIFNKATNNVAMSSEEREAVSKTIAKTLINNESQLSAIENSSASRAVRNRVDPTKAIQNMRPPGVPSTSNLFKTPQVPSAQVQTGQIMKNPSDGKYYLFRGQTGTEDWRYKQNWTEIK